MLGWEGSTPSVDTSLVGNPLPMALQFAPPSIVLKSWFAAATYSVLLFVGSMAMAVSAFPDGTPGIPCDASAQCMPSSSERCTKAEEPGSLLAAVLPAAKSTLEFVGPSTIRVTTLKPGVDRGSALQSTPPFTLRT